MEQRETTISLWARRVMEACWLLALILVPVYFSLLSDRHFEPDKATVLRSLVMVMGAAWFIVVAERMQAFKERVQWRAWLRSPLIVPTLVYAGVFILTTLTSILFWTSLFGGYNRLQGTYTNLAYIAVFGAIVANVRRREQLERIITVIITASLPVLGYGWVQNQSIDPLPWAGNTAERVASTMGNSIFVAAYLILVLPFVLYRLVASITNISMRDSAMYAARGADTSARTQKGDSAGIDALWMGAFAVLGIAQIATLFGVLKLGALIQAPLLAFDHWWIFPAIVIAVGSSMLLYSYRTTIAGRDDWRLYVPGALVIIVMLAILLGGYLNAPSCPNQTQICLNRASAGAKHAIDFRTWLLIGLGSYFVFYLAAILLPRRQSAEPSKLMNGISAGFYAVLALFTIVIIFFTQSRGPQLGMFVSLFAFMTLLLIQAYRTFRKRLFLGLLSGWFALALLGGGFLVALNTTDAFPGLRENRYIARLSNLLETDGGTGRVRVLIWRGDDMTRGAVDLVLANPLRTAIGWGPETMFVAYNPYYPPELANYESRGASPDRSHQAMLDELATKGALGLFSHLFLFGSFAILMMRLLRVNRFANLAATALFMIGIAAFFMVFLESIALGLIALASGLVAVGLAAWLGYARPLREPLQFGWQLLIIACVAAVVANFVENVFGIPIVSSLLYTWVIMGLGVVAGWFGGAYPLGNAATLQVVASSEPAVEAEAEPEVKQAGGTRRSRQQRGGKLPGRPATAKGGAAPWRPVYPLVLFVALISVWFFNLDGIYADMRFLQGKQFTDQGDTIETQLLGYAALQDAISASPREDLYYLSLGRSLMTLATQVSVTQDQLIRQTNDAALAQVSNQRPQAGASLDDLPEVDYSVAGITEGRNEFVRRFGPLQVLDYARLALEQAQRLNPRNKDHPANLGRLHASWFRNTERVDPEGAKVHLDDAIAAYEEAHKIAPQDVELTGQWAMLYTYRDDMASAERILNEALAIDPTYFRNLARLGELRRREGKLEEATDLFARAIAGNPRALGDLLDVAELPSERQERLDATMAAIESDPALLDRYLEGYAQAIERRPNDLGYRQLYVQVLSDTARYDTALTEAREALDMALELENTNLKQTFEAMIRVLEQKAPGS